MFDEKINKKSGLDGKGGGIGICGPDKLKRADGIGFQKVNALKGFF